MNGPSADVLARSGPDSDVLQDHFFISCHLLIPIDRNGGRAPRLGAERARRAGMLTWTNRRESHIFCVTAASSSSDHSTIPERVPTMVNTPSRNQRTHTNKLTSLMPLPYTVRGALANPRLGHSVPRYKAKPSTKLGQEIDNKLFTLSLTLLSSLFVSLT
ncbi:hypothetical protein B296_00020766 [Ensete ventricosum]|uniref:Uncharacterized protein n=1 Tax=Ensete ventricosum TaxID=4639 RepID=A0A426YDP7_ENSVE|nr:hypothetical protein B296_00020766 [Ensete ventricosum]